ncbi:PAS domain S-box protein [Oscillatoria sp. FACHB-1407]|uniref:PAS domain S-box protein n=1 Tax=Oscillatoria sp. FACHB-1407 TaxID=2692847 RepID=UPI0016888213|nr:PAS domain S-box protein [Oscillatoria sp. FACHB-1407]MBD2459506.1 PAS domain S-box protein [Oscillatoria sp. FACHB-1407]
MLASLPPNETSRLKKLYQYQILDTDAEQAFDDLTSLAAQICDTPIALISLIDRDRQWFKSRVGVAVSETSRDLAFCAHAILQSEPLIVSDARVDERFANNDLVIGEPYIQFYAGMPLVTPDGYRLGTLCVIDRVTRQLSTAQLTALETLSRQVVHLLELRHHLAKRQQSEKQLQQDILQREQVEAALKRSLQELTSIQFALDESSIVVVTDAQGIIHYVNDKFCEISQYSQTELIGQTHRLINSGCHSREFFQHMWSTISRGEVWQGEIKNQAKDGTFYWVDTTIVPSMREGKPYQYTAIHHDITVCKQAEASAQESKERLHFVLQHMPVMLDAFDSEWNVVFWNQECEQVTGYAAHEIINNPNALELAYPDPAYRQQMIDHWMRQGNSYRNWEWDITCKDGSVRTIAWSNISEQFPIPGWAAWGIGVDVTERKRAEKALLQQAERERLVGAIAQRIRQSLDLDQTLNTTVSEVRQLLQADRVLTFRVNPEGVGWVTNESVAPEYLRLLDHPLPDDIFPPECHELYRQGRVRIITDIEQDAMAPCLVETLRNLGVKSKLVVPILYKEELWGLLIAHQCGQSRQWQPSEVELLRQLSTQVAIAIHQSELYEQAQTELAERKRAEQKIREQAELLDVATDAILVRNLDNQIIFWNKGAERLYGWLATEAYGKKVAELLYRDYPSDAEDIHQAVLRQGMWQGELHQWTKAEQEVVVESRWTLVRNLHGEPTAILMVNTDITQKKQLERQFLRAQRMESIGTLAGGIAHDLNNVLAPILMAVPLLEMQFRDPNDVKSRQWLDIVESSARRGASLVKQVLSFARGLEGERSLLEVKHLIWEIREILEKTFPKSITFSTNLSPDLWLIHGDATQLHQILLNLCVNARDAMPNGGILQISAQNRELGESDIQLHIDARVGSYVVVTVSDTGSGMSEEIMDRIFDPFFTTKEIGKGTGLGLPTVMNIVKSHNGFILVSSQIGVGTKFQAYLPALPGDKSFNLPKLSFPRGANQLVLVVDDEAAIREITRTTLEDNGYRVLTASNGAEAISLYTQQCNEIQVVLIDLMMPSMGGVEAIRHLQTIGASLKIVATSGLTTPEQLVGIEVSQILRKPFTTQELLTTLHQTLSS